tara:strand:+ start:1826 stop:2689 length:864 start_codon:yes stop_codon:yes gene_type:complete
MKNIKVIQAKYTDRHNIVNFLIQNHVHKTHKENWLNLFEHKWSELDNYGYLLKDNENLVGYFGLIFSNHKFFDGHLNANIHSWVVKKNYRQYSLKILSEAMKLENVLFISHSTINEILKIYYKYNWKILDENYYIIFGALNFQNNLKIEEITKLNNDFLNQDHKKIYLDHNKYNARFFKVIYNQKEIFLIGKNRKFKKIFNYFEILYVSDLNFLNENSFRFINLLKKQTKSIFLKIDSRFIFNPKKLILKKLKINNTKKIFFCKKKIKKEIISKYENLYSEIFLLDT